MSDPCFNAYGNRKVETAERFEVSICEHQTVHLSLIDGNGNTFAYAPIMPGESFKLRDALTEYCRFIDRSELAGMESRGEA